MKKNLFYLFIILFLIFIIFYREDISRLFSSEIIEVEIASSTPETVEVKKKDRVELVLIEDGSTFGNLVATSGVDYALAMKIYEAAQDVYDLVKIRVGRNIELTYDKDTDELKTLAYQIDTEEKLFVEKIASSSPDLSTSSSTKKIVYTWQARREAIPYEIKTVSKGGVIESSMYQTALDEDIDIRAIIELANAFQWSIDFAMDPRKGDTFQFVYEERHLDGEYVMPGQVLAGKYINAGEEYLLYYFEESEENKGFFDENGNSVQKMFLKAPVAFKYISSGFTTGQRWVEAFNVSTGHRAIDYAAPAGTPIRVVGDGTVTSAGWNSGGYGYLTKIRHNSTYSTNYAHQSRIIVSRGQKVKQGQTIGYVGSTGFSTGPHLHYEMVKNGIKINPLREVLPPGKPIKEENQERFQEVIEEYKQLLKK